MRQTPVKEKAKQFIKLLIKENPDYNYLKEIFRQIRKDLNINVNRSSIGKLPHVPTEDEIERYYDIVWKSRNMQHVVMIKTLLYTGVRVTELIHIKISEIDFDRCQIRITQEKGKNDRIVPFPNGFGEILAIHVDNAKKKKQTYLFESSWKKQYTDMGIRKILSSYPGKAGIDHLISPHKFRHFLFTWMKKQGVDDDLLQPYSGHESRQLLEIYSKLSLSDAQEIYEDKIKNFPV